MKKRLSLPLMILVSFLGTSGCGDPVPPDLRQGVQVVRYLSAKRQLSRSSFSFVYPQGKPSQFVRWMFSTLGSAEWPPSEEMAEVHPILREQAQAIGAPLIPKGVALVPREPRADRGKQVVVHADDAHHKIKVDAYLHPEAEPVLTREWDLPRVAPNAL